MHCQGTSFRAIRTVNESLLLILTTLDGRLILYRLLTAQEPLSPDCIYSVRHPFIF